MAEFFWGIRPADWQTRNDELIIVTECTKATSWIFHGARSQVMNRQSLKLEAGSEEGRMDYPMVKTAEVPGSADHYAVLDILSVKAFREPYHFTQHLSDIGMSTRHLPSSRTGTRNFVRGAVPHCNQVNSTWPVLHLPIAAG
jgi:hypothetical protein